jgi:hypothetical protein
MASFQSISRYSLLLLSVSVGCQHASPPAKPTPVPVDEDELSSRISYPFVKGQPLGVNGKKEPFIVRSKQGGTEYSVEIPDSGEDYDIEIPLAALQPQTPTGQALPSDLPSPTRTDHELLAALPQVGRSAPVQTKLVDRAFGVGEVARQGGSPSYVLELAKINELYRQRQYEYALIAVDDLLSFYPNSPKLYKMKGTILVRMQDYVLAEKAWTRAADLDRDDSTLVKALDRLRASRAPARTGTPIAP